MRHSYHDSECLFLKFMFSNSTNIIMELSKTSFGPFDLFTIETGYFKLDGGAMFGVVPKTLWSRKIEPDEKNRIPMTERSLLIHSRNTDRIYLIDNGCGTKFDDKFVDIYQIDFSKYSLELSLEHHSYSPSDISDMIFTHLHFDHCGGTTYFNDNGELMHTFPEATYHISETQWDTANHPNVREQASFMKENIEPIADSNRLNLLKEGHEYEEGLTHVLMHGHSRGQQLIKISSGKETLVFAADLIPTTAHIPLPWVMGYDMCAVETLSEKAAFLNIASEEDWYLYMEHDYETEIVQVEKSGRKYQVKRELTLSEL